MPTLRRIRSVFNEVALDPAPWAGLYLPLVYGSQYISNPDKSAAVALGLGLLTFGLVAGASFKKAITGHGKGVPFKTLAVMTAAMLGANMVHMAPTLSVASVVNDPQIRTNVMLWGAGFFSVIGCWLLGEEEKRNREFKKWYSKPMLHFIIADISATQFPSIASVLALGALGQVLARAPESDQKTVHTVKDLILKHTTAPRILAFSYILAVAEMAQKNLMYAAALTAGGIIAYPLLEPKMNRILPHDVRSALKRELV